MIQCGAVINRRARRRPSDSDGKRESPYLVPDDGLLDGGKILQRRQQDVAPLGTTDILDKTPKLVTQRDQNFVLVLDRFCRGNKKIKAQRRVQHYDDRISTQGRALTVKEGDQLLASAFWSQSQRDGRQTPDRIKTE